MSNNPYGYPVEIGEHDPASWDERGPVCRREINGWVCTLWPGHTGPHVAHLLGKVLAYGPPDLPDYMQVSEGL